MELLKIQRKKDNNRLKCLKGCVICRVLQYFIIYRCSCKIYGWKTYRFFFLPLKSTNRAAAFLLIFVTLFNILTLTPMIYPVSAYQRFQQYRTHSFGHEWDSWKNWRLEMIAEIQSAWWVSLKTATNCYIV